MESTEWGFAYISISSEVMKQLWMCVNESKQQTEISEWICWHTASRAAASWRGSCCVSAASQVSPAVCRLQQHLLLRSVAAPDRPRVSDRLRVSLQTDPVKRFPFQAGLSPQAVPVSTTMLMMQRLLHTDSHRPGLHQEHWRNEAAEQHSFTCCSQLWALARSVQSDQLEVVRWVHREWSWLQELGHFWIWTRFLLWGSVLCVLFKRKMVGL